MIFKQWRCSCGKKGRDMTGKLAQCPACLAMITLSEKWYVKYINSSGRPQEVAVSTKKKDCELYLQQMAVKKARGESTDRDPVVTFSDAIKIFGNHLKNVRPSTKLNYECSLKNLMAYFGDIDLTHIGQYQATSYQLDMQEKYSAGRINLDILVLKMLMKKAILYHHKHDMSNLNKALRSLSQWKSLNANMKERVLTDEEINTLLQSTHGATRLAIYIGLMTGLRLGNVEGLLWRDINFEAKTITIDAARMKDKEPLTIPLHDNLAQALKEWRMSQPIGPKVLPKDRLDSQMRTAFDKAGLKDASFHALRRTYATNLIKSGVDYGTVAEFLGHSSSDFTRKIYVNLSNDHKLSSIRAYGDSIAIPAG